MPSNIDSHITFARDHLPVHTYILLSLHIQTSTTSRSGTGREEKHIPESKRSGAGIAGEGKHNASLVDLHVSERDMLHCESLNSETH